MMCGVTSPSPRVATYLEKLPAGAGSHPGCQAKAAMLRRALAEQPLTGDDLERLPPAIRPTVTCPPLDGEWVPDVHLAAVLMAIADARGWTDDAYLAWLRALNERMFRSLFPAAMAPGSVDALTRSVPERWSLFHRGSGLALAASAPGRAVIRMTFPPWLFHGLTLRQFTPIWEVALGLAARDVRVSLEEERADGAAWAASWGA